MSQQVGLHVVERHGFAEAEVLMKGCVAMRTTTASVVRNLRLEPEIGSAAGASLR